MRFFLEERATTGSRRVVTAFWEEEGWSLVDNGSDEDSGVGTLTESGFKEGWMLVDTVLDEESEVDILTDAGSKEGRTLVDTEPDEEVRSLKDTGFDEVMLVDIEKA
jgi:hypothetical protein